MFVLISCDASHCTQTHACGYGYILISDRKTVKGGSRFVEPRENNNHCEVMAIANSVQKALNAGVMRKGDTLRIETDCKAFVDAVNGDCSICDKDFADVLDFIKSLISAYRLVLQVEHVNSHCGKKGGKYWRNRFCDGQARKHMREMRAQILNN